MTILLYTLSKCVTTPLCGLCLMSSDCECDLRVFLNFFFCFFLGMYYNYNVIWHIMDATYHDVHKYYDFVNLNKGFMTSLGTITVDT